MTSFHHNSIVFDWHADTPTLVRYGYDFGIRHKPPLPSAALGFHVDLPRLIEGGVTAQVLALPSLPRRFPLGWTSPKRAVLRQIAAVEEAASCYSEQFVLVRSARETRQARAEGRVAGLLAIEGAHALEGDLGEVENFAARGVVYLGLLHLSANDAGQPTYGLGDKTAPGLTPFGYDVISALNGHKVIVDLAHLRRDGFMEAVQHSRAPVIVSHAGAMGVHAHPRNLDDDQLRAIANSGGTVGVIYARIFLGGADLSQLCAHLAHMIAVGGEDLPSLGSDYDGLIVPVRGLEDVSELPALTDALLKAGFSEAQVEKILGLNAMRVLAAVRG